MNVEILLGQHKTNFRENIITSSKADKYHLVEKYNSVGNRKHSKTKYHCFYLKIKMQKRGGRVLQRQNYLESNYLTFLEKRGCAFMYPTAGHSSGNPRCPGTPPRPGKQCYPPAHRAQACSRHRVPRHGIPPAQHPAGRSCLHPQGAGATSCSSLPAPSHKTPPKQAAGLLQRSTHARAAGFPLPTLSLCQGENFFF